MGQELIPIGTGKLETDSGIDGFQTLQSHQKQLRNRMISHEMICLDSAATDYIVNSLVYGAGLSERAANILNDGRIFSLVPQGTSRGRANQLRLGGLASQRNSAQWLSEYICSKLALRSDWHFIAQDIWLRSNDKVECQCEHLKILAGRNSIYYTMNDDSPCCSALHELIRETNSAVFVGFIIRMDGNETEFHNAIEFEHSGYIEEIVLSAYDQESFIIWTRDFGRCSVLN